MARPTRVRTTAAAAALAAATLVATAVAATPAGAAVKAPKAGQYIGRTGEQRPVELRVAKRRIQRAALQFQCNFATAHATIGAVKLHRTRRGYTFSARRTAKLTYTDGRGSQFGRVTLAGRFGRAARSASGRMTMHSPHCGSSGPVRWSAGYARKPVRHPKAGHYAGTSAQHLGVALYLSGDSIQLADISFRCGSTTGRTSLNDIELRPTRLGYAFSFDEHGSVSYGDGKPDQNGTVQISGRFRPDGRRASGRFRVVTHRCGGTGQVKWSVERQTG